MYEKATVLDYKGKKIWIKHVTKQLYCVNGRYISFNPKQDISSATVVAMALDEFYSPMFNNVPQDETMVFSESKNGELNIFPTPLSTATFDISGAPVVLEEYKQWQKTVSESEIYIDDCSNMDIIEWINRKSNKRKENV